MSQWHALNYKIAAVSLSPVTDILLYCRRRGERLLEISRHCIVCNMVQMRNLRVQKDLIFTSRKENLGKDEISNRHIVVTDSFFGTELLKAANYWLFSMIYINMFGVYLKWRINKRYCILFSLPEPAGHCAGSPEQSK